MKLSMTFWAAPQYGRRFYQLAGMELWERFSLHGMKALLTLYLVRQVLADGHAAPWGLAGLRAALESMWGPLTPLGFASQLYGLYAASTYFVLPFGGLVGDRLIGRRSAVVAGALLIAAGHATLTSESLLLPALILLILGTGLLKANLAAQVGELFPAQDPRRGNAFAIYLAFLNVGVMLGPLVCGLLAQSYGWSYGFGAAGVAMLAGLALYIAMPQAPATDRRDNDVARGSVASGTSLASAVAAILIVILCFCAYEQMFNIFLVWIAGNVQLAIGGFSVPPAWFVSADGVLTIAMVIVTTRVKAFARLRHGDRLLAGCVAIILGYGVLSLTAWVGLRTMAAPLLVLLLLDLGVALVWPAGLAIVTAASPPRWGGVMVGAFYLHGFFANLVVGSLGMLYERMPVPLFWSMHAGIAGLGCVLALLLRRLVNGSGGGSGGGHDQQTVSSTEESAAR